MWESKFKNIQAFMGGITLIDKDAIKNMTVEQREELANEYQKECLITSSDIQQLVDFMTEVMLIIKDTPIKVDCKFLLEAIQTGTTSKDPTKLEMTQIAEGEY